MNSSEVQRIVVACDGDNRFGSAVSEQFESSPAYAVVKTQGHCIRCYEIVRNPHADTHEPLAAPEFVAQLGADVVIAGGMGHRAIVFFEDLGITVAVPATGTVRATVNAHALGRLEATSATPGSAALSQVRL